MGFPSDVVHSGSRRPVAPSPGYPASYWQSLRYFAIYRVIVAVLMLAIVTAFSNAATIGAHHRALFAYTAAGYALFGVLCFAPIRARRPYFHLQLSLQVAADIAFIVVLMYASGGIASGLGLLLLAALAAASLISRGRLAMFHAALASIAVLLEHTYEVLAHDGSPALFVQAGFLSIGYFATAWLAFMLARYTVGAELLAAQREIDLANLAQVNQLVIQDMDDGVLVVDERGVIRTRNAKAETLLGPTPMGDEVRLSDYSTLLAERFLRWRDYTGAEHEPFSPPASRTPVAARFVPVGRQRNLGAVIFLEDLSRVQAQSRQLKLAALGRLTANIAHEIRNPLSAISHASELLQEEPGLDEAVGRLLRIIHDNTQRLDRMVQDVLRLNRRDNAHVERFRAGEFLATFIDQFCQIEKTPNTTFVLALAGGIDREIRFDRSHLNQVMWNLARNALRYCRREPGSVRIEVALDKGDARRLCIEVCDDGPGVAPEFRSQLFEPFFTTAATGTGLGLYIAREVCEANAAGLDYVETGTGCQFRISCSLP